MNRRLVNAMHFSMPAPDEGGTAPQDSGEQSPAAAEGAPGGFPASTPLAEMTADQREAYWKHQARKHEDRSKATADYDAIKAELATLKAATQTDAEKAIEAAKTEAAAQAEERVRKSLAPRLVAAEFRAACAGRISDERLAAILEPLDTTKFLAGDGEVDTDKVKAFVDGIAPASDGKKWPDMGQGRRQSQKATGVDAGRELFAARAKQ